MPSSEDRSFADRLSDYVPVPCDEVRLLFSVTDTFTIQGRGIVLLPELKLVDDERFRVGDLVRLRRPDGTEDVVPIRGLEFLKCEDGPCKLVIMLSGMSKEDVPVGTEVWSIDQPSLGPV